MKRICLVSSQVSGLLLLKALQIQVDFLLGIGKLMLDLAFSLVCQAACDVRFLKKRGALKPALKATNVVIFSHILELKLKMNGC